MDVTLPEGLAYSTHSAETGTYANGVWTIGELASGASKMLTITATVAAETRGKTLDVEATISATEPVKITETVDGREERGDIPRACSGPGSD